MVLLGGREQDPASLPRAASVAHMAAGKPIGADASGEIADALDEAAAAIAQALADTADWGEAGTRDGQHHSDLAADAAALAVLGARGFAVLSEESGLTVGERDVTVVLDPLDGSTNASRGLSWWAISLCAVDVHGPVAALVVDLRHGDRWAAVRSGGSTRNGEPITPSRCTDIGDAIIGINGVPAGHGGWAQFRALGATALDLCAVADGTLDGYLDCTTDSLGVWDYLGASLICREAGASVVDADGRELKVLDHAARRSPVGAASGSLLAALVALHPEFGRPGRGLA